MTTAAVAWPVLAKAARADDAQGVASSRMSYSRFLVSVYVAKLGAGCLLPKGRF